MRAKVEQLLESYGFASRELATGEKIYEKKGIESVDVVLDEEGIQSLYVAQVEYLKLEVSDYGICVRLYYDSLFYIGSICKSWEEIKFFDLEF